MKRSPVAHRLLALFVAGWLVFDFPLLQLWLGQPLRLFVVWALLIGALAWVLESAPDDEP